MSQHWDAVEGFDGDCWLAGSLFLAYMIKTKISHELSTEQYFHNIPHYNRVKLLEL